MKDISGDSDDEKKKKRQMTRTADNFQSGGETIKTYRLEESLRQRTGKLPKTMFNP